MWNLTRFCSGEVAKLPKLALTHHETIYLDSGNLIYKILSFSIPSEHHKKLQGGANTVHQSFFVRQ